MGRPKGSRQTGDRRRFRPKHLRGGRKKGPQPDRKGPIPPRSRKSPNELEALRAGHSIVSAATLRDPLFQVIGPHGDRRIEKLDPLAKAAELAQLISTQTLVPR